MRTRRALKHQGMRFHNMRELLAYREKGKMTINRTGTLKTGAAGLGFPAILRAQDKIRIRHLTPLTGSANVDQA